MPAYRWLRDHAYNELSLDLMPIMNSVSYDLIVKSQPKNGFSWNEIENPKLEPPSKDFSDVPLLSVTTVIKQVVQISLAGCQLPKYPAKIGGKLSLR